MIVIQARGLTVLRHRDDDRFFKSPRVTLCSVYINLVFIQFFFSLVILLCLTFYSSHLYMFYTFDLIIRLYNKYICRLDIIRIMTLLNS